MSEKNNISQLKLLWPLVAIYKKYIFLALLLLLLGAIANLYIPVAFRQMIDLGFSPEHQHELSKYFILVLVVCLLMILFTSLRYFWVSWIGQQVVTDLRKKVYNKILYQTSEFFETTKTGEILSRINTDTTLVETVVGSTLSVSLRSLVVLIGACIMLIVTSPKLSLFIGVIVPIIVLPISIIGKKVQKLSKLEQEKLADSSALATETINSVHVVQSYAQEDKESKKYTKAITDALIASINSTKMLTIMSMLIGWVVFGGIIAVLWMGANDVINGEMSAGTLSQFIMYSIMVATTTGALSSVWGELKKAAGALERIIELLNQEPGIRDSKNAIELPEKINGNIEFKNIEFSYPSNEKVKILDDFSLQVKAGETVAIVGSSGAGKSTLFELLLRFYETQKGEILIENYPLKDIKIRSLRSKFALVAQETVIFSTTAMDNIGYGSKNSSNHQSKIKKAAKISNIHEYIETLDSGYETYLGERGVRLSGGQAQRLSIARAVASSPSILLLDEATSALDAENEMVVQQALTEIMKNSTTLVIAHRLATIREADRIVVLDQGKLVAQGTHEELLESSPLYAKLSKLQFRK